MIEDRELLKNIVLDALALPVERRRAFVDNFCIGNDSLRSEVNSLLDAAGASENVLDTGRFDLAGKLAPANIERSGQQFGNYRIIREIGTGGMGAVFLAERSDGRFDQRVAIKIIRQSVVSSDLEQYFKREQQILAGLNHPNIARLLDGGVSAGGESYFVMEYVEGEPLIEFAAGLSVDKTLLLFRHICEAVAFAHRNLIIHRDLKPSNILVTKDGQPKLLDFGLAKIVVDGPIDAAQSTFRALTPTYASPEQLRGNNVTTASDIYSLGVVLYELLSGDTPFHFEGKDLEQMIHTIIDTEPKPPSAVLTAEIRSSGQKKTRPAGVFEMAGSLNADLDNIALTALRKEPERRYPSVEAFADDIQRYIDGRPITARSNTFAYIAAKFVKRNKIWVSAAALIMIAVLTATAISLRQSAVARRESARSKAVNQFMQKMFLNAFPEAQSSGKKGAQASVIDTMQESARRLDDGELASEPEVQAELRRVIGVGLLSLGLYPEAQRELEMAFDEHVQIYGYEGRETLYSEMDLASLFVAKAEYPRAVDIFDHRFERLRSEYENGSIEPDFYLNKLSDYALVMRATGKTEAAETHLREGLNLAEKHHIKERVNGFSTLLSLILLDQGRFDEAESNQEAQVARLRQLPENDAAQLAPALTLLGSVQMEKGKLPPARQSLTEAESIYRKFFNPEYTPIFDNIRLQAQVAYLSGDFATAKQMTEAVLQNYNKTLSPKYVSFATALTIKGLSLAKLGKAAEAETILNDALALRRANLPPGHFMTALTQGALGEVLLDEHKYAEAAPLLKESLESLRRSQMSENARVTLAAQRFARLESESGTVVH